MVARLQNVHAESLIILCRGEDGDKSDHRQLQTAFLYAFELVMLYHEMQLKVVAG